MYTKIFERKKNICIYIYNEKERLIRRSMEHERNRGLVNNYRY